MTGCFCRKWCKRNVIEKGGGESTYLGKLYLFSGLKMGICSKWQKKEENEKKNNFPEDIKNIFKCATHLQMLISYADFITGRV